MKYFLTLLIAASCISAEPAAGKSIIPVNKNNSTIMPIDAKGRSQDLKKAFAFLKKERPGAKVIVHAGSQTFDNVVDMIPLENDTIMIIKTSSAQGIHFFVVFVEEVSNIYYK